MATVSDLLTQRTYPGRGLVATVTGDGRRCVVYFLTGRSPASRQRELAVLDGGDVAVRSTAADQPADALRHYVAAARRNDVVVVGNGDQVVPIAEALAAGQQELQAAAAHTFEPDDPIFTPRIWLSTTTDPAAPCVLGYARRSERAGGAVDRVLWSTGALTPGDGLLMSTYDGSAGSVTTSRLPRDIHTAAETGPDLLNEIWAALDPELRVAAFSVDPGDIAGTLRLVG